MKRYAAGNSLKNDNTLMKLFLTLFGWNRVLPGLVLLFAIVSVCVNVSAYASPQAKPVVVAEAELRELAPVNWYTGTVISREQARLAAEVTGRLLWVAEVGSEIDKGEVVARIDDALLQQEYAERQADIGRIKAQLGFLRQEESRLQRLAKQNNAAKSQLEKVVSERLAAQSELKAAQARERRTHEELLRCQLRAPFPGVVTERFLHAGEWADNGTAVVTMTDPHRLEAQSWVSVSALPFVKTGTAIDLRVADNVYSGKIRILVPVSDLRSRLYELRVDMPPGQWSVGQSVRIAVPTQHAREVLAVQRDALVLRRGSISLYKIDSDNIARRVVVTTGIASGPYIEVSGDLQAGDRIVIRGSERLRPDDAVSIQPADQPL